MKVKAFLVTSILINIFLLYLILKPVKSNDDVYRNVIKRVYNEKKEALKNDSIRLVNRDLQYKKDLKRINFLRKKDHEKYLHEISKLQRIDSDSAFTYILDSIKQVCCTNNAR